jgi:beta-glucosidase
MSQSYLFPDAFLWGAATAAYQVEGAAAEEGRGPSIWDTFSHLPGRIAHDDNGDVSVDQYHRYEEDIQLMQRLGIQAYRFSVSWSRIFPQGDGVPNPRGVAYYDRLVDCLLAHGIQPWLTFYHWDLPQALEDRFGGWTSPEIADRFAD